MPSITLNGEDKVVASSNLAALIHECGIGEKKFAVELNKEVVPRNEHEGTLLKDGDIIEIVQFVGGG